MPWWSCLVRHNNLNTRQVSGHNFLLRPDHRRGRQTVHYFSSLKSWQSAHSHLELSPSTLRPARIYRQLADHRRKLKYTQFLRAIRTSLTESLAENVHPAEDRQDPALGHRRRCRARVHHPPSQESMFRPHKYNDQMGRVIE